MKGDLSRETFDRALHHSAVRLQQGRILTDADWNEQAELTRYRAERQARDTIGPCGAPLEAAGYALVAETNALAVHAVNPNVVWVAAEDGVLLASLDGGATWRLVDLQTSAHVRAIHQAGDVGWAVGDGGLVRRTSDQGASWTVRNAGTLHALRGVAVFDTERAWAVGDGGIVVATDDGGASWRLVQTEAPRLYAVRFADEFAGLAVGQRGAIVATTDGGRTWTAVRSGTDAHLRALAGLGTAHAWAAGSGGTILRSEDAGATWLPCDTPVSAPLYAIAFRNAEEGWAAGAGGTLLHTFDGGAHWTLEDAGTGATLRALSVFGGGPAWLVGEQSTALRLGGGAPEEARPVLPAVNLSIGPGRCYVDGVLCELETRASYAHQPDGGAGRRLGPGTYLLYLDVWQRHVSTLEAPAMREPALAGVDTATRARTIAQVRALELTAADRFVKNCDSTIAAWNALVDAPRPRLAARAEPQPATAGLCEIAATAGYRRLENQLYRVEVHEGGANPSFKWSRENGSVAYAVVGVSVDPTLQTTTVRLAARGRDANLDLAAHDRVELIDDDADLTQRAGTVLEYLKDGDDELELVLAGVPGGTIGRDPSRHPILRRWDHGPGVAGTHVLPVVEGRWIGLEDGVEVRFEDGGAYRPGDYWLIPARTITADVEWPRDEDGDPLPRPPAGIADAYCRLGIVEVDSAGVVRVLGDCRERFPSLTALEQLLYVSGDGQDAPPNAPLPQPLVVRVARGALPVPAVGVRFKVESGGGTLGSGGSQFETNTGAEGQALCNWTLGPAAAAPGRFQRVRASLIDVKGRVLPGQFIDFCATASLALQYVSGDGQQAAAGTTLPQPLEVRVANGADGVAGIVLAASLDAGGGNLLAPALTTDAQGQASVQWQLGAGGTQRATIRLVDSDGHTLQRVSFDATVAAPAAAAGAGCDITVGRGAQFPELTDALVERLLQQGRGSACICLMPGMHTLPALAAKGNREFRLALHGCGHASVVNLHGPITIEDFVAVELRDLVIQAEGEAGLLLRKNDGVRLANVLFERRDRSRIVPLRVVGARRVSVTGCEFANAMPAVAAVFEGIAVDCRIAQNRFVGLVSFYGDTRDVPPPELLRELAALGAGLRLTPDDTQLTFRDNSLSMLTIGSAMAESLRQGTASGVFASAVMHGNTFSEQSNLFVAALLGFDTNAFVAATRDSKTPYGVMLATRATAVGNLAVEVGDHASLHFVTPNNGNFEKAANRIFIRP